MQSKSWIILSSSIIIFLLATITSLMMWTDTYSIIHTNRNSYPSEPNRNFLKVEYILAHPKKYDSFIFGSSKVGSINPNHITDGNYYNMTYSKGIPHEHLLNLKLFLHSGIKIKHLLIGLEEMSYQDPFLPRQNQGITKAHPMATGTTWFEYYLFYFFRFPEKLDRSIFVDKLFNNEQQFPMDVLDQKGFYKYLTLMFKNRDINETAYINDQKFVIPSGFHGNELNSTLNDIREITSICQQNHIDLKIFINPIHDTTYNATDKVLFSQFKHDLATITDYYDFSGYNSISRNNLYWTDTTHYDIRVGEYILNSLYHYGYPPIDFGHYVQKIDINQTNGIGL